MSDQTISMLLTDEGRPTAVPGTATPHFLGRVNDYRRLMTRGAVLLLITLGLYRFWLVTATRRYLCGHTAIAGDTLEYNGSAFELLLGFLLALTVLVPIYAGLFIATIKLDLARELSVLIGLVLLAWLAQFARYRARRYRLARTLFRGVRFHQTGAAWRYAVRALIWWLVVVLTLGLAYPWARTSLERYKMGHSFYGDLPGWFEGSALRLFLRGFWLWLAIVGPFFAGLYLTLRSVDWEMLWRVVEQGGADMAARIEGSVPGITQAMVAAIATVFWALIAGILLYPAFRALTLRWWLSGITFGQLTVRSYLRTGQIYRIYLRFFWINVVFFVTAAAFGALMLTLIGYLLAHGQQSKIGETIAVALLVGGYVVFALVYAVLYQVEVKFALWRAAWNTLELSGMRTLDQVRAFGKPSSSFSGGLVDALHVESI
jgi:uncharacterized membrane protein YjgN (DUF898 family)